MHHTSEALDQNGRRRQAEGMENSEVARRKEEVRKYMAVWRENNKKAIMGYGERYRKSHPWIDTLSNIRSRCRYPTNKAYNQYGGKGIRCLINIKEIEALWIRDGASNMINPSIDRIDSSKDYDFDNCRFIEWNENSKDGISKIMIPVYKIVEGKKRIRFNCILDAERLMAKERGVPAVPSRMRGIYKCLAGKTHTAYGYKWEAEKFLKGGK